MSCGKTPTRRQVHGKNRGSVAAKHAKKVASHGTPPFTKGAHGGGSKGPVKLPRPKQKVTRSPKKTAKKLPPLSPAARRRLKAWQKAHPLKNNFAAWAKAHPFKNTPFTRAQFLKWQRAHPLKHGGHTRAVAIKHKVACQIKTRHAASATRHQRPKQKKRATGPTFSLHNKPAPAVRAPKTTRAAKAARARRAR